MNVAGVVKQLGLTTALLGAFALLCALYAWSTGELETGRGLVATALLGGFLGLILRVVLRDAPTQTGPREGLMFALGFWVLTPIAASPAFISSGVAPNWMAAIFEATSNLSTTGTTAVGPDQPDALRLWRSALQFVGGCAGAVIAVVVLAALNLAGPGVHRSHLLTLPRDDLFSRLGRVSAVVAGIYGAVALIGAILLAGLGAPLLEAVEIAVAGATTSAPLADAPPLTGAAGVIGPLVIVLALLVGATNVAYHADLARSGPRAYLRDGEAALLIIGFLLVGAGLCLAAGAFQPRLFFEAVSFMTTSGMRVTPGDGVLDLMPQPGPEILAFVGGSALSTAGGLKIARVFVLMSRAQIEFRRLAFANALAPLTYRGRSRDDSVVMGVWVYLMAYIGAMVALMLALTLTGVAFEPAMRASVGAISNTGPLVDPALSGTPSSWTLAALSFGFALGRVEVLALMPIFALDFWRR